MTIGVLFVPLGTWLKLKYADVVELAQQYDGPGTAAEGCSISAANEGKEVSRHTLQQEIQNCYAFCFQIVPRTSFAQQRPSYLVQRFWGPVQ